MPVTTETLGAVFDWDGVIIDSSRQHEESWELLAEELGTPLPAGFFKATFGMRNVQIIPEFTDWTTAEETEKIAEIGERKEELYRNILRRDGIEPLPGVVRLLNDLNAAGVPCSVGSSTPLKNIETIIDFIGCAGNFQAISAAEDVVRGKPAPDIFLKAAEKIGRDPRHCIVFEDAYVGIDAARSAGSTVIAVATTNPLEALCKAHHAVASLEDVGVETMLRVVNENQSV